MGLRRHRRVAGASALQPRTGRLLRCLVGAVRREGAVPRQRGHRPRPPLHRVRQRPGAGPQRPDRQGGGALGDRDDRAGTVVSGEHHRRQPLPDRPGRQVRGQGAGHARDRDRLSRTGPFGADSGRGHAGTGGAAGHVLRGAEHAAVHARGERFLGGAGRQRARPSRPHAWAVLPAGLGGRTHHPARGQGPGGRVPGHDRRQVRGRQAARNVHDGGHGRLRRGGGAGLQRRHPDDRGGVRRAASAESQAQRAHLTPPPRRVRRAAGGTRGHGHERPGGLQRRRADRGQRQTRRGRGRRPALRGRRVPREYAPEHGDQQPRVHLPELAARVPHGAPAGRVGFLCRARGHRLEALRPVLDIRGVLRRVPAQPPGGRSRPHRTTHPLRGAGLALQPLPAPLRDDRRLH